jgi:hypothetical protein
MSPIDIIWKKRYTFLEEGVVFSHLFLFINEEGETHSCTGTPLVSGCFPRTDHRGDDPGQ